MGRGRGTGDEAEPLGSPARPTDDPSSIGTVARAFEQKAGGRAGVRRINIGVRRAVSPATPSRRTAAVGLRFGVPLDAGQATVLRATDVAIGPGRIVLLLGPSGAGKTSALSQIERRYAGGTVVGRVRFPKTAAVVDAVAPWAPLGDVLSLLTACGLAEVPLWLRRLEELSDGEQFRARLAKAVALQVRCRGVVPLLCDEFCSGLHRRVARAISFCLHKLAKRRGLSLVLASSQKDIVADLRPHAIVRLHGRGACDVEERDVRRGRPFSGRRRMRIEIGSKRDYDAFASMHYRTGDELGFVDKVFVMRDGANGEVVGIVVYSHGPLELALRNQATGGWFSRNPGRLNRHLRILRRLVLHPDLRGCGLGHYLVRKTLPRVGIRFVECLAAMGEFNPVFEKAGMTRIGQYEISPRSRAAYSALQALDADPAGRAFPLQVCRRRSVRRIVARVVHDWYAATTAGGAARVERQSPAFLAQTFRALIGSRPVYYLWEKTVGGRRPRRTQMEIERHENAGR